VQGIDPPAQNIWNLNTESGRLLADEDNFSHARVAVLAWEAKQKLFSGAPAVGQRVRLGGVTFEVVGVLNARMQEGDDDINRTVYIPYNTMGLLKDIHYVGSIWLDYEALDHDKVTKTIRQTMAVAHSFNPEDQRAIFVFDAQKQLAQFEMITLGIKILMGFIGTLTLGIGGVGLMNIMLVSVTQRTREIGMEKALGARKRDILFQFLATARWRRTPKPAISRCSSSRASSPLPPASSRLLDSPAECFPPSAPPTSIPSRRCATNKRTCFAADQRRSTLINAGFKGRGGRY
jgi:putative ABC transport system permease protein